MRFEEIILAQYGVDGKVWLDALPALLASFSERWDLSISSPFENLSCNYVASAQRADGTPVVLKLGIPNDELCAEIAALQHFAGQGMVRLLEADAEKGAMLLERALPGETLWDAEEKFATERLLAVMPQLWRPYDGDYPFKTVEDWALAFSRLRERHNDRTGKLDYAHVEKAERIFSELIVSSAEPVLLHGDLHHDNLLSTGNGYIATDPKGVLGEPCYEVGAFLRNPWHTLLARENPLKDTQRRVDRIVDYLGFDRQRVVGWAFYQAVLSAIWCDEVGGDCAEWFLKVVEIFERL